MRADRAEFSWPSGHAARSIQHMANEPNEGKWYEGSDGKPTRLELDETDLARLRAAKRGPMLDEIGLLAYPAGTWAAWFDGLGLHDLAERARTELAQCTNAGARTAEMMLGGRRPSRLPENKSEQTDGTQW